MSFLPINLSGAATEIIILIGIFVVLFALALALGKSRMFAFVLAFYPAILSYSQFPFLDKILFFRKTDLQIFLNSIALFSVFFILTFLVINFLTRNDHSYTSVKRKTLKTIILALSAWLLVLLTINQIVVLKGIEKFFPISHDVFGNPQFFFWLLIVPLVIILIFIRR